MVLNMLELACRIYNEALATIPEFTPLPHYPCTARSHARPACRAARERV